MFGSGAFDCKNCPKTNNPEASKFCPAWWNMPWKDDGKEFIKSDCSYRMLPNILQVLGQSITLTMSTNHEMNQRLDKTDAMCKNVSEKMEAMAKVFYLAAEYEEQKRITNG